MSYWCRCAALWPRTAMTRTSSTVQAQMQNKMWFPLAILRQCLLVNEFARDGEIRRERPLQHLEQLILQWMV